MQCGLCLENRRSVEPSIFNFELMIIRPPNHWFCGLFFGTVGIQFSSHNLVAVCNMCSFPNLEAGWKVWLGYCIPKANGTDHALRFSDSYAQLSVPSTWFLLGPQLDSFELWQPQIQFKKLYLPYFSHQYFHVKLPCVWVCPTTKWGFPKIGVPQNHPFKWDFPF